MFLNPTSVRVSWSTSQVEQVEKYDVTYKPTDARCVLTIPILIQTLISRCTNNTWKKYYFHFRVLFTLVSIYLSREMTIFRWKYAQFVLITCLRNVFSKLSFFVGHIQTGIWFTKGMICQMILMFDGRKFYLFIIWRDNRGIKYWIFYFLSFYARARDIIRKIDIMKKV